MLVAAGTPGIWTLTVLNPTHNHGPIVEKPRPVPQHKVRKGQIPAVPYDWPHDATLTPYTTALVIIDMQKDCTYWHDLLFALAFMVITLTIIAVCSPGGYMEYQGYDISAAQSLIPKLQQVLNTFRTAGFPVYYTREGKPPRSWSWWASG